MHATVPLSTHSPLPRMFPRALVLLRLFSLCLLQRGSVWV